MPRPKIVNEERFFARLQQYFWSNWRDLYAINIIFIPLIGSCIVEVIAEPKASVSWCVALITMTNRLYKILASLL